MTNQEWKNKQINKEHIEMRDLLIDIIQTLDSEYSREVQSTKNSIGLIRSKVDYILNNRSR